MNTPLSILEVAEAVQEQWASEVITYGLDVSRWGDGPTEPSGQVYEWDASTRAWEEVTSTVMPSGTITVTDNVITLKPLQSLTAGKYYLLLVTFTIAGKGTPFVARAMLKAQGLTTVAPGTREKLLGLG